MALLWTKKILMVAVILLLIGGVIYLMLPQPLALDLGTPERRDVQEFIAEEATTRLAHEYLIDMPVPGTLQRIALEVGDYVEEGQVVARIDRFELEQQLRALDAQIQQTRARLDGVDVAEPRAEDFATAALRVDEARDALQIAEREREIAGINLIDAERTLERMQQLLAEGITSEAERDAAERAARAAQETLESARLAEDAARGSVRVAELNLQRLEGTVGDQEYMREMHHAEIESLQAQRRVIENDLEKTELRAPVSGPILEKFVLDRRVLAPGAPLLRLGDLATMEIESDVLSEEVVRINTGDPVHITGRALAGAEVWGEVARIYPAAFTKISALGIEQQRVKVIIAFDNSDLQLRVGTRVDVHIITDRSEDTLAVPERATFRREGRWYIFTLERGRAQITPITIGLRNNEWAEVLDGLDPDATIILEPRTELEPGMHVVSR